MSSQATQSDQPPSDHLLSDQPPGDAQPYNSSQSKRRGRPPKTSAKTAPPASGYYIHNLLHFHTYIKNKSLTIIICYFTFVQPYWQINAPPPVMP